MDALSVGEAVAGGCLLFFVPGYTVAKAVFPERRLAGPEGVRWGIELVALALVLSVVLTVAVGYLLLAGAPGGFSASWGDPLLEAVLAAIAGIAFVTGWLEGAYARAPPARRPLPVEPGGADAWELSDRLGRLQRERQGLERELRRALASDDDAKARIRSRLEHVVEEEQALRRQREAEYEL
jgi:hypothetical protein